MIRSLALHSRQSLQPAPMIMAWHRPRPTWIVLDTLKRYRVHWIKLNKFLPISNKIYVKLELFSLELIFIFIIMLFVDYLLKTARKTWYELNKYSQSINAIDIKQPAWNILLSLTCKSWSINQPRNTFKNQSHCWKIIKTSNNYKKYNQFWKPSKFKSKLTLTIW